MSTPQLTFGILGSAGRQSLNELSGYHSEVVPDPVRNIPIYSGPPIKANGLTVVSLFSGAGGLDLGLEMAGFETVACVENDNDCMDTIRANRPNWKPVDSYDGDITRISATDLLKHTGLSVGQVALVVGGPPCPPFSNIGKKTGDTVAEGRLYQDFVRIVRELRPMAFIFENVAGFAQDKFSSIRAKIEGRLALEGYSTTSAVLNSADFGVPQVRKRFIMLGIRRAPRLGFPMMSHAEDAEYASLLYHDIGLRQQSRKIREWVSLRECFAGVEAVRDQTSPALRMGLSDLVLERMKHIKKGQNFKVLPWELRPECWKTGRHQGADTFGRLDPEKPSVTIRTCAYNPSKGRYIHPHEDRGLDTLELAAIQTFPLDWRFTGSLVSQGRQIGNAVPPLMARALGYSISAQLTRPQP